MKTNYEKAFDMIAGSRAAMGFNSKTMVMKMVDAKKAVLLASKPNWYKPSNNEYPDEIIIKSMDNPRIIVKHHAEYMPYQVEYDYRYKTFHQPGLCTTYELKEVIAWAYMPIF